MACKPTKPSNKATTSNKKEVPQKKKQNPFTKK